MKQYDVKISYAALSDMEQIYSYIADRLLEPDTKIECHRFFHGYHLGLIVTCFALQINNSQTYN